jgi:hypothetical protein
MNEYELFVGYIRDDRRIINKTAIIGPSVCCGNNGGGPGWDPEQLWDLGYLDRFRDSLSEVSVEQ